MEQLLKEIQNGNKEAFTQFILQKEEKKVVWSKMKLNKIVAPLLGVIIVSTSVVFAGAELYNTTLTDNNTYSEIIDGQTYFHFDESESGLEYNRRSQLLKFLDKEGNEVKLLEESGYGSELGEYEHLDNYTMRTLYTKPLYQEVIPDTMKVVIKRVIAYSNGNPKEYIGNWDFEIPIAENSYTITLDGVMVITLTRK